MFFQEGWPVFSPEPYTGEISGAFSEDGKGSWEWIRFEDLDNTMKKAVQCTKQEEEELLASGIVHKCGDFENARPTRAVSGFDASGLAYWGKYVYS